jgi:hypothetical protein
MYFKKLPEETMAQPAKSLPIWSSWKIDQNLYVCKERPLPVILYEHLYNSLKQKLQPYVLIESKLRTER